MNKRYYEHTLPIIRGSLSNTYSREYYRENKKEKILVIYVIFRIFFLFKS